MAGSIGGGCSGAGPPSAIVIYVFHLAYQICCFPFFFLFSVSSASLVLFLRLTYTQNTIFSTVTNNILDIVFLLASF